MTTKWVITSLTLIVSIPAPCARGPPLHDRPSPAARCLGPDGPRLYRLSFPGRRQAASRLPRPGSARRAEDGTPVVGRTGAPCLHGWLASIHARRPIGLSASDRTPDPRIIGAPRPGFGASSRP